MGDDQSSVDDQFVSPGQSADPLAYLLVLLSTSVLRLDGHF